MDFNYYLFSRIEKGIVYKNFQVDGVYDIAVNKAHTIAMKLWAHDFIDVYFILREKKYDFYNSLMWVKAVY